ncbi:hypothetical protein OM794_21780 [Halomonas sp. BDJS001]|uniref:hypothetical protein n=1 Tax=Halomonas sp. BDJS001 TaxID=2992143 RepID=UPI0022362EEC|nr:hypothetical protein [Halomonas sp. BDJS001]UZH09921.1 hypothetical protein OM794_21780 [Halomonas sp. BDJS001]
MRTITLWLSAFNETLATKTAVDLRISASFLSWFLPLIASHGLLPLHWSGFLFLCVPIFYSSPVGGDCDLRCRQVVIKNIRICIDGVNENYYIVVVAFDETPQAKTETASFLSWFLPLIASHGLFAAPLERLSFSSVC